MVFSDKCILIYEYSGISPIKFDLTNDAQPVGELRRGIEDIDETYTEADDVDQSPDSKTVIDETGEDTTITDEDMEDFRCSVTNCAVTTKMLQVRLPRQRGRATAAEDELLRFIEEDDELVCTVCDRTKSQHCRFEVCSDTQRCSTVYQHRRYERAREAFREQTCRVFTSVV